MRLFGFFFFFFLESQVILHTGTSHSSGVLRTGTNKGRKRPSLLHHMISDLDMFPMFRVNRFQDGSRTRICRDGSNKYYICLSTYINIGLYT